MKKNTETAFVKDAFPADVWIGRLSDLLKVVSAMEKDERSAAFTFLKSKFNSEWPSDSY